MLNRVLYLFFIPYDTCIEYKDTLSLCGVTQKSEGLEIDSSFVVPINLESLSQSIQTCLSLCPWFLLFNLRFVTIYGRLDRTTYSTTPHIMPCLYKNNLKFSRFLNENRWVIAVRHTKLVSKSFHAWPDVLNSVLYSSFCGT